MRIVPLLHHTNSTLSSTPTRPASFLSLLCLWLIPTNTLSVPRRDAVFIFVSKGIPHGRTPPFVRFPDPAMRVPGRVHITATNGVRSRLFTTTRVMTPAPDGGSGIQQATRLVGFVAECGRWEGWRIRPEMSTPMPAFALPGTRASSSHRRRARRPRSQASNLHMTRPRRGYPSGSCVCRAAVQTDGMKEWLLGLDSNQQPIG